MSTERAHSTETTLPDDLASLVGEITHVVVGLDAEPWHLRPDEQTGRATILIGQNAARVRGQLDGAGFQVRESDVPVREGFDALLEVSRP